MKSIMDICYSQEADQYLDLHLPECDRFPVFLYFHGGGIEKGDKAAQRNDAFIKHLTDKGIAVASANYSMDPTAKYPEFIDATFTNDLDKITIKDKTAQDVLNLFKEEL